MQGWVRWSGERFLHIKYNQKVVQTQHTSNKQLVPKSFHELGSIGGSDLRGRRMAKKVQKERGGNAGKRGKCGEES